MPHELLDCPPYFAMPIGSMAYIVYMQYNAMSQCSNLMLAISKEWCCLLRHAQPMMLQSVLHAACAPHLHES